MDPKKTPFTDAYVKEQQSALSLGIKVCATTGIMVLAVGLIVLVFLSDKALVQGLIFLTLGNIYMVWAALSKQRRNAFLENLELFKMIQQLPQGK